MEVTLRVLAVFIFGAFNFAHQILIQKHSQVQRGTALKKSNIYIIRRIVENKMIELYQICNIDYNNNNFVNT